MSNSNIKELLAKLKTEIEASEVDTETRTMLHGLESEIHGMLNETSEDKASVTMMETAELLETRFASEHPVAESVVREIINALARMGI